MCAANYACNHVSPTIKPRSPVQESEGGELSHNEIQELINIANEVADHTRRGEPSLVYTCSSAITDFFLSHKILHCSGTVIL